ncbi:hypothetical protein VHEMI02417 [[Torrubiella] hemipterigena]|nr:hypothetical protein VHEMI02417 [[Torrubiella] hemipterigena]
MKDIQISADKTEVAIEPGNVWYDVYTHLLPHNITVIGGRVSPIGTSGLTLGGGISFFSNQHGWACDNVNAYEVVMADGTLRTVTAKQYPDLYWALRGGGNNFGIVTRLHLAAYPQGDLWAGSRFYPLTDENTKAHTEALAHFTERSTEDPKAQVIQAYVYAQVYNMYVLASDLQYSVPQPFPAILSNFTAIQGAFTDTLRITDLPSLTLEFNENQPNGLRQAWHATMVEIDAELLQELVAIWKAGVEDVKNLKGSLPTLAMQPLSLDVLRLMGKNGGNALGLAGGKKPLLLVSLLFTWADEADDELVYHTANTLFDRVVEAAKAKGRYNKYIYLNYGGQDQKVLQSYGDDNYARLKAISHKYDPQQVFQKLQPGGFKL